MVEVRVLPQCYFSSFQRLISSSRMSFVLGLPFLLSLDSRGWSAAWRSLVVVIRSPFTTLCVCVFVLCVCEWNGYTSNLNKILSMMSHVRTRTISGIWRRNTALWGNCSPRIWRRFFSFSVVRILILLDFTFYLNIYVIDHLTIAIDGIENLHEDRMKKNPRLVTGGRTEGRRQVDGGTRKCVTGGTEEKNYMGRHRQQRHTKYDRRVDYVQYFSHHTSMIQYFYPCILE